MDKELAKYIAEILKIVAIAQFGYFGYRSLESPDHAAFYVSGFVFLLMVSVGAFLIYLGRDSK
jgi:hypothetical protein